MRVVDLFGMGVWVGRLWIEWDTGWRCILVSMCVPSVGGYM